MTVQLAAETSHFPLSAAFGTVTWGERADAKTRVRGIDLADGAGAWAIGLQAWEGTREIPAATTKPWWDASSFGFTGREHDAGGLTYHRDRYMQAAFGRWTQADRLGFDAGPNAFEYVRGQPTRLVDPSGQLPFLMLPLFGAAIGGIFGLLGGLAQGGLSKAQLVQEFISGAMFGAAATIGPHGHALALTHDADTTKAGPLPSTRLSRASPALRAPRTPFRLRATSAPALYARPLPDVGCR